MATDAAALPVAADDFATRLLRWFDVNGRHDLPWQHPRSAYRVWVSEIMLQQTQVRVVVPYFERWMQALPNLADLAAADADTVHALWAGLGYYARARNLHAAARRCVALHEGALPRDIEALLALPGIGRSTAGAILAQAHGLRFPILDGNVKRSLARYHGIRGWPGTRAVELELWALAEAHLPQTRLADYTQAVMDFGATLCTRQNPACVLCPLQDACVARREGATAEIPAPKPARTLPQRETTMLVVIDTDGRLLLERRPPAGIWSGLWSLPEAADADAAHRALARHARVEFDAGEPLPAIEHGFSHYRLRIQPVLWRGAGPIDRVAEDGVRWQPLAALDQVGLPAPVRRLLGGIAVS
ncbi:A/G-specific adenine glycosylase [Coralloluteibacterium stylophorae]|uniref:Adenine DNA glycosylase n=1 Tax=Coralloluteibacterium stylophorae TaxID=1776034 RepID=A0A8J7VTP3_9GAMM|nr:A/G-specific adenine glycosylase [Coralloluteibacterium stylophorae]MBS7456169.1 A/G-specific adenine glycosylase [Coralloluteibacterium stylophorae]